MRAWVTFCASLVVLSIASALFGCSSQCIRNSDCPVSYVCSANACVLEVEDAGATDGDTPDGQAASMGDAGVRSDGAAPTTDGSTADAGTARDGG